MASYNRRMESNSFSMNDLAEATGIEGRTIRSYIERGLLSGAEARGRAASYSEEHLHRLRAIQALRRARPNIQLNDIRIIFQQMSPQQISDFCSGSLRATATALAETIDDAEKPEALRAVGHFVEPQQEFDASRENHARAVETTLLHAPDELTGLERVLEGLRRIVRPGGA